MKPTIGSSLDLIPVDFVESGIVRLRGGGLRAVLECPTLAFGIKGEVEQRAVLDGWAQLLNSLEHPLQFRIQTRPLASAPDSAAEDSSADTESRLRSSHQDLLRRLGGERRMLERRFQVVVPWDPAIASGGFLRWKDAEVRRDAGPAELQQRVAWIADAMRRIDLEPRQLSGTELTGLFLGSLCPEAALAGRAPAEDDLDPWRELVAPTATSERVFDLQVGSRYIRVLGLSRYPRRLIPGWLGLLQNFEGDLDVSLHVHPSPSQSVMSALERKDAELGSTARIAEGQGRRADAYRRAGLEDVHELQDLLARGEERLFDTTVYFGVWADSRVELEAATRRLEALLGSRLLQVRRLLFQMEPGLTSILPLGLDRIGLRRRLTTSALSASFPFSGSDLAADSGVLYGLNPTSRTPVVLDRFQLENHNAVVFATSGAGKSYAVKVELLRGWLQGWHFHVIDPESEYADIVGALGGAVRHLSPGHPAGLNPFQVSSEPGALSARISSVLTLFELLGGGLSAVQRAAVEEALSFAYAVRGFSDEPAGQQLTPPALHDVLERLHRQQSSIGSELEPLLSRLERYRSGSGRWLFSAAEEAEDEAGSTAYVLRGLPEEERAPAMLMVLDRIWERLQHSAAPTLVVLDEAWWLMRYPDTARYVFRLVKTARKRRAGLTLVTQDVSDVLSSPFGESVVTNSALQVLMRQAPQAIPKLAELFRLTPAEQSWLLNAQPGEGLLMTQGKRVPFQVIASGEEARLIEGRKEAA
jgi:hypothetical protein